MPNAGFGVFSLHHVNKTGSVNGWTTVILFMKNIEERAGSIDARLLLSEVQESQNHRNGDDEERYDRRNKNLIGGRRFPVFTFY